MEKKICYQCNKEKLLIDFRLQKKGNYYCNKCKQCYKEYDAKYKKQNKELIRQKAIKYNKEHRIEQKVKKQEYNRNHKKERSLCDQKRKTEIAQYNKQYKTKHKKELKIHAQKRKTETNQRYVQRYKTDIQFYLKRRLRSRLWTALKNKQKAGSAVKDLGCSIPELIIHLESQFTEGMTWKNKGKWHIDHIKPLSLFDLTDRVQFLEACNWKNLQPLWGPDNISKSNKY